MKGIGAMECPDDIEPIPYNMEKYMAFKLGSLRFLDSIQFMKSDLDKLASNLGAEGCKEITREDGSKLPCTKPSHLWRIDSDRCFAHPEISRSLVSMSHQNCSKYISEKVCTPMSI